MRSQRFARYPFPIAFLVGIVSLLMLLPATAQDELHPPQFLYRDENRLNLLNGYTGEATELSMEVADRDRFEWSPDGRYLLARLLNDEDSRYCLNLYDVDLDVWVYSEPIACAVGDIMFSHDAMRIIYATNDGTNGILWMYSLVDETSQELYRTTDGNELIPADITDIQPSPTERYLTFITYFSLQGGPSNSFVVMNTESHGSFTIYGANPYYASYSPIWSANDDWFLITLQEEYVATNHRGDVYLVNSATGETYRLTYTPTVFERDIHWTPDGGIAFTVVSEQEFAFTLEEAMNVDVVPREAIITPEPYDPSYSNNPMQRDMISPDPEIGAWVTPMSGQENGSTYELNIGYIGTLYPTAYFSAPIPDAYQFNNILIGWRPSDVYYPLG